MRYKRLAVSWGLVLSLLFAGLAEARTVPGVDEPYDPGNYYSRESISYPDSKPSPFALKELMQGKVYDYKRHMKSIDFGGDFEKWLATLLDQNMKWLIDMLGLGDKGNDFLKKLVDRNRDFGILDWPGRDGLFLNEGSQWIRIRKDEDDKFPWMAKIYREGIENARANQADTEERMELMNSVLENSKEAEGNKEAIQADTEMQGLMNGELERRGRLLANYGLVEAARDKLRLDRDRRAMVAQERVMTFRVMDRNNMTDQDMAVGVKEGQGFKDF